MVKKLFVGNLPFDVTDEELKETFRRVGTCTSAVVIMDRQTGRSRGFGFVEMSTEEEARRAMQELQGASLRDRQISVTEARERTAGGPAPRAFKPAPRFGPDAPPSGRPFQKSGKSRRGVRGKKRSIG